MSKKKRYDEYQWITSLNKPVRVSELSMNELREALCDCLDTIEVIRTYLLPAEDVARRFMCGDNDWQAYRGTGQRAGYAVMNSSGCDVLDSYRDRESAEQRVQEALEDGHQLEVAEIYLKQIK